MITHIDFQVPSSDDVCLKYLITQNHDNWLVLLHHRNRKLELTVIYFCHLDLAWCKIWSILLGIIYLMCATTQRWSHAISCSIKCSMHKCSSAYLTQSCLWFHCVFSYIYSMTLRYYVVSKGSVTVQVLFCFLFLWATQILC